MSERQKLLDLYFPTVVRYLGIALVVFYAGGSAFGAALPEGVLIAATGMILYKTVRGGGDDGPAK
jgi:membrane protein DedA with SNARE-associated domain